MKKYLILAAAALLVSCSSKNNDSEKFVGSWIEVMPANPDIVQGVTLDKTGEASSIGMATLQYEKWKAEDGKLILWGKSIGNGQTIDFSDTLNVVSVTPDSMLLDQFGRYRISYYKVASPNDVKPYNVVDSLKKPEVQAPLETRTYTGALPIESCIEVKNKLTIYNYENNGDGVYKLNSVYMRADGETPEGNTYGRVYTLRGDAKDPNATVYQLIPFSGTDTLNFLYKENELVLLNHTLSGITSKSDSTIFRLENKEVK